MKRFIETSRWKDRWYGPLSPICKSIMDYIRDNCDCAGVWEPNLTIAEFETGWAKVGSVLDSDGNRALAKTFPAEVNADPTSRTVLNWPRVLELLNQDDAIELRSEFESPKVRVPQIQQLPSNKLWLPKFIAFQWLSPADPRLIIGWPDKKDVTTHKPVLKALKAARAVEMFNSYYPGVLSENALIGVSEGSFQIPESSNQFRNPTIDDVRSWPEAKDIPDATLQLFHAHFTSTGWKVPGTTRRYDDLPSLLTKWKLKDEKATSEKEETPAQIRIRIQEIESAILRAQRKTHKPTPTSQPVITDEAKSEIADLKKRRDELRKKLVN